jgi:hypothetical protein
MYIACLHTYAERIILQTIKQQDENYECDNFIFW